MEPQFQKLSGVTRTELLLEKLATSSFLSLWCWPRPFKVDGKELCDLLAIFEDRVLVFFDRESRTFETSEREQDLIWKRWKKEVIDKQITTASGAERYLASGRDIFIDEKRQTKLPLKLAGKSRVHKIIVAHGAKNACKSAAVENVSGSLAIAYGKAMDAPELPFFVRLEQNEPVHILDSENLEIVLGELDTFADFVAYLDEKEAAIARLNYLSYCGEEDLLAHYYSNFDDQQHRYRIDASAEANSIHIGEGFWQSFCASKPYAARKAANQQSYLWDNLIEKAASSALQKTLGGNTDAFSGQSAIHEMAKERRVSRRILSRGIAAAIDAFPKTDDPLVRHLSFSVSQDSDKGYVFLQFQGLSFKSYDEYREARRLLLEVACGAAKNKFPSLKKVVGIAVEPPAFNKSISEDFILLECAEWTVQQRKYYKDANSECKFFETGNAKAVKGRVQEFPNLRIRSPKIGPNAHCPCGSGKKYKKCHGRF